jgi:ATP-dependent Clp protease adapter protein ClpS
MTSTATPDTDQIEDIDIQNFFEDEHLWSIIIWDSNLTSFEEVITGCMNILGHSRKRGQAIADKVHLTGKAVAGQRPKEEAMKAVDLFGKYHVIASMEQ